MRFGSPATRLTALAVIGSLVVACTAASTPSPAPTAAPTAAPTGAASPTAATGELPKPEKSSITIGFAAGGEPSSAAAILAGLDKIFDKYGMKATLTSFEGSAKAVGALQGNQVDIGFTDSGSALSSQLTDVPLVVVGINAVILTDNLVCQSSIKTAADVKGKRIAISTFGGTSHAAALLSLKALKLAPTDASITQVGGQGARLAALSGGSIDCAIVDKNIEADMIAQGFSITASIWKPPAQSFGRSAMLVRKDFLKSNPNTVLVALAANLEGQNMIWTDAAKAARLWAQWTQSTEAKARPLIDDFVTVGNRGLNWNEGAFTNAQKVIAAVNPDIIDVKPADAYDRSLLKMLEDIGFYDKIGNPAKGIPQ
jgi:NitT/TauT family transport system substrate-binding protein